jgi:hypothetical protein
MGKSGWNMMVHDFLWVDRARGRSCLSPVSPARTRAVPPPRLDPIVGRPVTLRNVGATRIDGIAWSGQVRSHRGR